MTLGSRLVVSRFRGCLIGHAVGDALGAAVEFMSRDRIVERFGPRGLETFEAWRNEAGLAQRRGAITDDTQMSVATAKGLLETFERGKSRGLWHPAEAVWRAYLAWLRSQEDPGLRRYPGSTCLGALRGGVAGCIDEPVNDSKGSGGIMRVAPVGLAFEPDEAFEQGAEIAALTHGHPSGYLAAGFLADVVSRLVRGSSRRGREWETTRGGRVAAAVAETREVLLGYDEHDEVLEKVDAAVELYMLDAELTQGFETLGEGWIAEEALGIGLFSALNFPDDFAEGVLASVNITGDSDTTGAITGALLGASLGIDAVPAEWSSTVEGRQELLRLADSLFETYIATAIE